VTFGFDFVLMVCICYLLFSANGTRGFDRPEMDVQFGVGKNFRRSEKDIEENSTMAARTRPGKGGNPRAGWKPCNLPRRAATHFVDEPPYAVLCLSEPMQAVRCAVCLTFSFFCQTSSLEDFHFEAPVAVTLALFINGIIQPKTPGHESTRRMKIAK